MAWALLAFLGLLAFALALGRTGGRAFLLVVIALLVVADTGDRAPVMGSATAEVSLPVGLVGRGLDAPEEIGSTLAQVATELTEMRQAAYSAAVAGKGATIAADTCDIKEENWFAYAEGGYIQRSFLLAVRGTRCDAGCVGGMGVSRLDGPGRKRSRLSSRCNCHRDCGVRIAGPSGDRLRVGFHSTEDPSWPLAQRTAVVLCRLCRVIPRVGCCCVRRYFPGPTALELVRTDMRRQSCRERGGEGRDG
jgi:hypothetical protein